MIAPFYSLLPKENTHVDPEETSEIRDAFEIHAFIQRGSSNPAWQEKCYEKWMGQFSISQRLGPLLYSYIIYIYIYFYTIYVYYISIYTYIHISKYRWDVYSLKSARWRIEGWETKHEPGWCWLYRKAVDLDEVKYKLSSLVCPHQPATISLPNFFPTNF